MPEPSPAEQADDLALLREFIVRLGGAMVVAGDSIDTVHHTLERVAGAYGQGRFEFFVLPTGLFVESGEAASARVQLSVERRGARLRFDQIAALYDLAHRAGRAEVAPGDGLAELARINALPPPRGWLARVAGHAVLTLGLALLLQPTPGGVVAALGLGLLVGVLKLPRLATLDLIFPVVAAFVVATTVFTVTRISGIGDNPMRVLIPPLTTFLPGGVLTIATVELAAGEVISGASRLVNGFVQLGLLAFGIVAAASLVGIDDRFLTDDPLNRLGWWAPWAGVALIALGDHLHFAAPMRTVPWILLVLIIAYGAQTIGGAVFGAELSGFFGGLAMTPLVLWIDARADGTPSMVTFLPAFWLLVPGAIGLIGITEMVGVDRDVGSDELSMALTTIVSIALGVLIGSAAFHTATAGMRKVAMTLPAPLNRRWRRR